MKIRSKYYTWSDFGHYNYIKLLPGTDAKALEAKLGDWVRKYIDIPDDVYKAIKDQNFGFRLQRVTDIHLNSHLRWELEPNGYMSYIYMMTAAAFLILIIATVNFINLTTAQSAERAKEIGIRKALGAFRNRLQFNLQVIIAGELTGHGRSRIFVQVASPFFTLTTGKPLDIDYGFFVLSLFIMALITGVLLEFSLPFIWLL